MLISLVLIMELVQAHFTAMRSSYYTRLHDLYVYMRHVVDTVRMTTRATNHLPRHTQP